MSTHYCTYFDYGYLARGLALYDSLRSHQPDATLWVLCMDERTYTALVSLSDPHLCPIALTDFERGDDDLLGAKANRSTIEYYFTCTPSLPLYLFAKDLTIETITYLDADLYFFASPDPIFAELGGRSIGVIEHRFPQRLRRLEKLGRYNVGWLTFRRTEIGLACLRWWRERCIEWCYDKYEPTRFADQKYLDEWPTMFPDLAVIQHKGANLAPWNIDNYQISHEDDEVLVDGQRLLFYHFHGFRPLSEHMYETRLHIYGVRVTQTILEALYAPYIQALRRKMMLTGTIESPRKHGLMDKYLGSIWQYIDRAKGHLERRYIFLRDERLIYYDRRFKPVYLRAPGHDTRT